MIWFALRVHPQREFAAERILRDDGFENVFVPLKHILAKPHRGQGRQLLARPVLAGYVFLGFDLPIAIPWGQVMRFEKLVIGVLGWQGEPMPFTDVDMLKWVFPLHQRPVPYIGHRGPRKRFRSSAARIVTGPYEGRSVRTVGLKGNEPDAIFELFQAAEQRRAA